MPLLRARAARTRRGTALLELALTTLPLVALFCTTVDVCLAVFVRNTLQHAVREGVRYAVTSRTRTGMGHDDSIRYAVRQAALGLLDGAPDSAIRIRYYVPGTLAETSSNLGGNIIEISVEDYTRPWRFALLGGQPALAWTVRSSDRMEPSPLGVAPPRTLP